MALKTLIQFPFFTPPNHQHSHRPVTEIRFARWNNANAEKFNRQQRTQKRIEDELRFEKRFNSAQNIADNYTDDDVSAAERNDNFRSTGTPSVPSRSSISGKKSKYSKPQINPRQSHPAFNTIFKVRKLPTKSEKAETGIKIGDNGVSYLIPEAPFEFQYSYTETPKAKPLKLREPAIAPFGPGTMPRPWTGRKPLPPSKKKIDFDSFKLPPPHKKGVKPVQAPGPFLAGSGPKYVKSREEILGEPLTKEEVKELVNSCLKSQRQLNMGRDGFTHNMLENIHAHWKRRRVCKIKCKGVCTVDMDNVRRQLEEKTGGKIIYGKGGVLYLFRGRNYNYRTRPRYPIMLWKPITPVYPRLVKQAPEGLTLEEASEMRKKGRGLTPICKLGKNGVYSDLANNVREAFEACELVRIDCQGMNPSDYRKIGAKLKDLVPCVLISFEHEHILVWRGKDWKSQFPILEEEKVGKTQSFSTSIKSHMEGEIVTDMHQLSEAASLSNVSASPAPFVGEDIGISEVENLRDDVGEALTPGLGDEHTLTLPPLAIVKYVGESNNFPVCFGFTVDDSESSAKSSETSSVVTGLNPDDGGTIAMSESNTNILAPQTSNEVQDVLKNAAHRGETGNMNMPWMNGVIMLRNQAIAVGSAVVLEESFLDADLVYENAVALAKSAPKGPVFEKRPRKVAVKITDAQEAEKVEAQKVAMIPERSTSEKKSSTNQKKKSLRGEYPSIVPKGSLRVDELAKLLA